MEEEHIFNILSFLKSKLRNKLTIHLDLCTLLQHFYAFENFWFDVVIHKWKEMHVWHDDEA
jgi:hypothetical protein